MIIDYSTCAFIYYYHAVIKTTCMANWITIYILALTFVIVTIQCVYNCFWYIFSVCHAEYNAITSYRGVISLKGSTLYVTASPCYVCAKLIAQAGIVEVVYLNVRDKDCIFEKTFKNCSIKVWLVKVKYIECPCINTIALFRPMYNSFNVKINVQGK